ncbi:MAG: cupin domain-containing protein [Calditrichia bacterium]
MAFTALQDLAEREVLPGFNVRFLHSQNMTFAYWTIEAGSILPEHSHPHEQVLAAITEGEIELTVGGEVKLLGPGDMAVIPSNVPHSARILSRCVLMDVFQPVREDYR